MEYFFKVPITNGQVLRLREINLREYIQLQKMCITSDDNSFESFMRDLIAEVSLDKLPKLNNVDFFIIIMYIIMVCIDNEKSFLTYRKGKKYKMNIRIGDIIDKVVDKYKDLSGNSFKTLPHPLLDGYKYHAVNFDNYILNYIDNNQTKIDPSTVILDLLSPESYAKIVEHYNEIIDEYKKTILFSICNADGEQVDFPFSLNMSDLILLIKLLTKDDLIAIYKNLYNLKMDAKLGYDEHEFITFSEYKLIVSMHMCRLDEERQAQQDNSDQNLP